MACNDTLPYDPAGCRHAIGWRDDDLAVSEVCEFESRQQRIELGRRHLRERRVLGEETPGCID
jgi:hypothetical protein